MNLLLTPFYTAKRNISSTDSYHAFNTYTHFRLFSQRTISYVGWLVKTDRSIYLSREDGLEEIGPSIRCPDHPDD